MSGLIIASPALQRDVRMAVKVCALQLKDLKDWQSVAQKPELDPENWGMRKQRQVGNDCQGQALATGIERSMFYTHGTKDQLSDVFAYQRTEEVDRSFGANQGSSIHGGVKVASQIGIPTEQLYPYTINGKWNYITSMREFKARQTPEVLASMERNRVATYEPAPEFQKALAGVVCGGSIHWGTGWPLRWNSQRIVTAYIAGEGGHATEGVWVKLINGKWHLKFLNSHGDGFYYVDEIGYEQARAKSPYGAFLMLPKDPVEQFYKGQFSLMG
jgi:hypothetical protein